jgi:hypothetical protein
MGVGHGVLPAKDEDLIVADSCQRYRKLPGRRRGLIFSASLWTGPDCLLSVRSERLHDHYKRYYFRDIQAIVITKVPRFLISTRALALAVLVLIAILIVRVRAPGLTVWLVWLWLLLAAFAACWLYLSVAHSCTCRLYTAVSRDNLPSLYRTWTVRKVLAELEQRIAQVQGVSTESWADAADFRSPGPAGAAEPALPGGRAAPAPSRTLASDIFLVSLFADGVAVAMGLRSPNPFLSELSAGLTVVQLVTGIWIFVEHHKGALRTAMQRLAIAALIFIGVATYAQAFADAYEAARAGAQRVPVSIGPHPPYGAIRPVYSVGVVLLAIAGLVLSFKSNGPREPPAAGG